MDDRRAKKDSPRTAGAPSSGEDDSMPGQRPLDIDEDACFYDWHGQPLSSAERRARVEAFHASARGGNIGARSEGTTPYPPARPQEINPRFFGDSAAPVVAPRDNGRASGSRVVSSALVLAAVAVLGGVTAVLFRPGPAHEGESQAVEAPSSVAAAPPQLVAPQPAPPADPALPVPAAEPAIQLTAETASSRATGAPSAVVPAAAPAARTEPRPAFQAPPRPVEIRRTPEPASSASVSPAVDTASRASDSPAPVDEPRPNPPARAMPPPISTPSNVVPGDTPKF
jgi:hypothetical protein